MSMFDTKEWSGYPREHGKPGVRNHILVIPTVNCANVVSEQISDAVEGVIPLTHQHGCSQLGRDAEQTFAVLRGFAANPNVGAILLIQLGCEVIDAVRLQMDIAQMGKPVELIGIQKLGGSLAAIERGRELVREYALRLSSEKKVNVPLGSLAIAIKWGDHDEAFPFHSELLPGLIDTILAYGGTVVLGEMEKWLQSGLLIERINPKAHDYNSWIEVQGTGARASQTLERGALSSTMPNLLHRLTGIRYAEHVGEPGVYVIEAPMSNTECLTAFAAAGAQVVLHFTQQCSPVGSPVLPVIKVGVDNLAQGVFEDVDVILQDSSSQQEMIHEIIQAFIRVVDGKQTISELMGHQEFVVHRLGISL
ncbi:MAG: UxaA family hydrolase [Bacilli bacterium]